LKIDCNITTTAQLDRGLAYGEACFETFRVIDGAIFCWPAHAERLQRGMACFGMQLTDAMLAAMHDEVLTQAASQGDDLLARLTVTGGEAAWGLTQRSEPRAYLQLYPFRQTDHPVQLQMRPYPVPPREKLAKFTADYAELLRASHGQLSLHTLFYHQGTILAATTANLLFFRQGAWYTPPLQPGVLPGVVRAFLLDAEAVTTCDCDCAQLQQCEALALINSGHFIQPVAALDGLALTESEYRIAPLQALLAAQPGVRL